MSARQIEAFQSLFLGTDRFPVGNARPVQPRNGREVTTDVGGVNREGDVGRNASSSSR